MPDFFQYHSPGLESPARRLLTVTPNDATDLAFATRAICVGTGGFIKVTTVGGDVGRIFVTAGTPFPIRVNRIWAAGTTALDIVGLA